MDTLPSRDALRNALAADGRASIESLARDLDESPAHVRRMMSELRADGIEVRGIVHPSVFGHHAVAHVLIAATGPTATLAARLAADTALPYLSAISGAHSFAAEIRLPDRARLRGALSELQQLPGVHHLTVDEYLDVVKDAGVRPSPIGDRSVDAIDRILLRELQEDGRAPFAALARSVSLTTASARTRVLRLIDHGIVKIGLRAQADESTVQIGFRAVGTGTETTRDALAEHPAVAYLATSLGDSAYVGTVESTSPAGAASALDELRAIPGVVRVETWTHLQILKEKYAETEGLDAPTDPPRKDAP